MAPRRGGTLAVFGAVARYDVKLEPFLLDEWLDAAVDAAPRWNLGSVAGPTWSLDELLGLATPAERASVAATRMSYSKAAGLDELRAAVAARHAVSENEVLIVTGGSEALLVIFFTAAEAGANVVLPAPCFPPTAAIPRALGLEVRTYRLEREKGYAIDLDEIAGLVDRRTRIVLINSPHNPSGAVVNDDTKRELVELARRHGASLVSDEVFHPIYHGATSGTAAAVGATVVGDASKALSLPGLRVGWLIEPDPALRTRYLRARMNFTITNSPLAERLAAIAVRNAEAILDRARRVASANLEALRAFVARWDEHLDWVAPAGGTCCFPWLRAGGSTRSLCEDLLAAGILVVPGDAFGEPAHMRIGFAADEDLPTALEAADGVLGSFVHLAPRPPVVAR
jgi:aspartate/methionine/tyrosine aminotransferase